MNQNIAQFEKRMTIENYREMREQNMELYFIGDIEQKLEELLTVENALLEDRNQKFAIWKVIILGALGIATVIVFLSLFNLIKRIKPLIEELLATQSKLEQANRDMEKTLKELKTLNREKENEIKAKEAAIDEAEKLNESLIAKNQQLDHFAYVASHDLQEPLRTVSNYLEIFQEDFPERLEGEATLYFQFINKAVERMRNLISGLLSFSRLGTSGQMEHIDLNVTLQKIREDLDSIIEQRNIILEYGNLPSVKGYRIEIKQLFQNLISNAIKFTAPNTDPHIIITFEETTNYYNFHIADNGIGIPEKDFSKIFDMFSRLHSAKDYEGQGIGLAFCKKIVELHLGNIWVSSKFGEGSTVHFTLKK
ncbi:MAG TPA: PAS domain-containing sensor histidine kinase [Aequorivita sp.]|nr:PAS domain-containing sensor histidine kinase [Aequorivita sp.]